MLTSLCFVVLEYLRGIYLFLHELHFSPSLPREELQKQHYAYLSRCCKGTWHWEQISISKNNQINPFKYKAVSDMQIQLWCAERVPKQYCLNTGFKLFEFWCYLKDSGCMNNNNPRGLEKLQLFQSALTTRSDKYLILTPKSIIIHYSKTY